MELLVLDDLDGAFPAVEDVLEDGAAAVDDEVRVLSGMGRPRSERRVVEDERVRVALVEVEDEGNAVVDRVEVRRHVKRERARVPADVEVVLGEDLVVIGIAELVGRRQRAGRRQEREQSHGSE